MRRRGITAFLLISFSGFWGYLLLAHLLLGWSLVNPLVQAPGGFLPAIAAIVVRRWVTREGFADAGSAVVVGLAAATGRSVRFTADVVPGVPLWAVPAVLCLLALVTTVVFWGEEFGWTGYLLRRVSPGRPRRAALVAGLIAAVWHYPLAFLGYAEFPNLPLGLLAWTVWIVCQEIILAWLRARSRSVWPACLAHAGNNMVLVTLTDGLLDGPGGFGVQGRQVLVVLVLIVVAAVPFIRVHREVEGHVEAAA
jgi:membrane protease YdiL (CAAX protease family)